ncbi:hypothetical protein [Arenibacter amylolyticus]|uniref:hypothetical protein n=1 Tax=Arenibacter amylolyticus TaxID=1406873 RepID=UPI000A3C561C|nr:hypothetical protein [Arenibacter amylolyticus]
MIRVISILIISVFLISCNNKKGQESQQKLDSLQRENERINSRLLEMEKQQNQTKYVWTIIEHKRGRYIVSSSNNKTGFEGPIKNYIYYSDVVKVDGFNEDKKYLLQDNLEKDLRGQFGYSVHSIQNRQTFVFDTYKEASEHRYNILN